MNLNRRVSLRKAAIGTSASCLFHHIHDDNNLAIFTTAPHTAHVEGHTKTIRLTLSLSLSLSLRALNC